MIWKTSKTLLIIAIVISITSCCNTIETKEVEKQEKYLLMATLYNYYAAEYQALAHQAFNIGKERLAHIRRERPEEGNLAVVVDIDETILNNSPYEAKSMLDGTSYESESWYEWCNMAVAEPVPGALEFLKFADSLGFNVFYISNRKEKFVGNGTRENIRNMGFPQTTDDHFLLRTDERNKERRRKSVSENYEIVLLAGDNLGDFYEDTDVFTEREAVMKSNRDNFGTKFIVLPNAIYGDWLTAIGIPGESKTIDSLLRMMAKPYQSQLK
ncbi:MAG: 5'-nucleotidase, lipoprotein e(P4) family [Bacteroidales bacterium]|jgi:5'-nucleotidase (lipoprotein e(P4) family)|nr:5'-nucleotidase, lipoprotein e(P4) family [Bacteroidales bacterium]